MHTAILHPLRIAAAAAFLAVASQAAVAQAIAGNLDIPPGGLRWGLDQVHYTNSGTCTGSTVDFGPAPVQLDLIDSVQGKVGSGIHPPTAPCVGGNFHVDATIYPFWAGGIMKPGNYSIRARVSTAPPNPYSSGTIVSMTPVAGASVRFEHPYSIAEVATGITPICPGCSTNYIGSARYVPPGSAPVPPPPGMVAPQLIEVSNANLGCCTNTFMGVSFPFTVTSGMLWIYDDTSGGARPPQWRQVSSGDQATLLEGNTAFLDAWSSPAYIAFPSALLAPTPSSSPITPQADMWWGGAGESGWGLSLGRNGDALFVAGFLYDYNGKPTWGVMQGGTWDSSHTTWTADVYIPHGTPFSQYDASKFDMQAPAGKATLQFTSPTSATFQYLGGYPHAIERYQFAPGDNGPYHGYWFGGAAQSGWGLHIAQQSDTVFATWYTYGADGTPTWFFMPGATKVSPTHYNGALYRTTGGSWPTMEHYDPSATHVTPAGTLDLTFTGDSAGTMTAVVDGKTITNPIQRFGF